MDTRLWLKNYPTRSTLDYPKISLYHYLKKVADQYLSLIHIFNMLIKKVAGDGHNCSTFLPGQVGKFLQRGPPFGSAFTKVQICRM